MNLRLRPALFLCLSAWPLAHSANAAVTVDYLMTTEIVSHGEPRSGTHQIRCDIDGPSFRITSRGGGESSVDDGLTTRFDSDPGHVNTPLAPPSGTISDPIRGTIPQDHLTTGPSTPGPDMFGRQTRTYVVEHTYAIGGWVLIVPLRRQHSHAHYVITVVDDVASSAALRVALSRGAGHVLALHPEAFTGLPLRIDGVIEGVDMGSTTTFHIEARSLKP